MTTYEKLAQEPEPVTVVAKVAAKSHAPCRHPCMRDLRRVDFAPLVQKFTSKYQLNLNQRELMQVLKSLDWHAIGFDKAGFQEAEKIVKLIKGAPALESGGYYLQKRIGKALQKFWAEEIFTAGCEIS